MHRIPAMLARVGAVAATAATVVALAAAAPADASRTQPPSESGCGRDHLTVYAGQVLRYRRVVGRTEIRIRTDWETTEDVTLRHPGSDDPSPWFLFERRPFEPADWARIEAQPGRLRPGVRAAAWVCDDDRNPTVDWNPPRER